MLNSSFSLIVPLLVDLNKSLGSMLMAFVNENKHQEVRIRLFLSLSLACDDDV